MRESREVSAEKRKRAYELSKKGLTIKEIAEKLNKTTRWVSQGIWKYKKEYCPSEINYKRIFTTKKKKPEPFELHAWAIKRTIRGKEEVSFREVFSTRTKAENMLNLLYDSEVSKVVPVVIKEYTNYDTQKQFFDKP